MHLWTRVVVLGSALLFAPLALADLPGPDAGSTFLNSGVLLSGSSRPEGFVPGLGAEVSIHRFAEKTVGFGLFAQWQTMEFEYHRIAGGLQGSLSLVGFELGVAHETASDELAATTSLHIAPFVSIGIVTLAVRFGRPLGEKAGTRPRHGSEVGVVLAFKYPHELE